MIEIGDVLQVFMHASSNEVKRTILIAQDDNDDQYLGVFINTKTHGAALEKISLAHLHPKFEKNVERAYLDADAFVDCYQPREYSKSELVDSFKNNKENFVGTATKEDINLIKSLVRQSPVIPSKTIKKYKI